MSISEIALRAIPGALIVNSGVGKLQLPAEVSHGLHQAATSGIKAIEKLPADSFARNLGIAEIGVGGALLAPFIPSRLAGAALTTFGAGLMTMYFNNDENTEADGIRPSQAGLSLAKDSWLVAIGLGLMFFPSKRK
ncbi:hypothetical protein QP027_02760 [Corynebacterium breve]|uniref:DoxX family membrane protein n=1 Tax=Corynebacterium breve TaxID=3049799 RepID=A0ABY8VFT6_9CORY|nr:hypothetical protein [Corynebacterium breve]WIM68339.1 hypothetical protein QP027_02760 [Corynebacterium breve]